MRKILYVFIVVMTMVAVENILGSNSDDIIITNNSLDGVSLQLLDGNNKIVKTGMGPIFLNPGQFFSLQNSYLNHKKSDQGFIDVTLIKFIFQHSSLSFTLPMPIASMNILSSDQIVTLINNSDQPVTAFFYDKDHNRLNSSDCWLISMHDEIQLGGPINRVYIPKDVVTITIDLGSGLTFSMPRPTVEVSNIFSSDQHDQLVKVTNNSEDFVNATLPNGNIIQFTSPGQSRYIPTTVGYMSITKSLGDGTWSPAQNIVMQEADFNLFV